MWLANLLALLLWTVRLSWVSSDSQELMKEVRYILPEEQPVGKVLGTIEPWGSSTFAFDPHRSPDEGPTRFLFLRRQDLFSLDERTGVLKTGARIDREEICARKKNCEILLDVAVKTGHSTRIVRVTVTVVDLNDNAPEFAGEGRVLEIPESAPVGSSYPVPPAFDRDSPEFGVRRYEMVTTADDDDDDRFELESSTSFGDRIDDWSFGRQPHALLYRGGDGGDDEQPKLILVRSLDRETKDVHKLTLVAVDGGTPARTGTVDVTVIVKDVNDNAPTFEQNHYSAVVRENLAPLTGVLQVRATDPDSDQNGRIVYSLLPLGQHLSPSESSSVDRAFDIDPKSGEVFVKGVVDHETTSLYKFAVVARDSGVEATSSSALLSIHVTDANDNHPEISVDTLSRTAGVAEVVEEMESGAFVAHVTVTDRDSGENGRTACRLNSTERFRLVSTTARDDGGDFQVVTATKLDREVESRHELLLVCHDSASHRLTSSASIVVHVLDSNDNPPLFGRQIYAALLAENNRIGDDVIVVQANDPDEGANGRVVYFIPGEEGEEEEGEGGGEGDHPHRTSHHSDQLFYIEPDTGAVKAAVSFDRERGATVEFRVCAKDGGSPPLTGTAVVRVTILDANDESPRFSQSAYSFAVRENQPSGTEVGSVAAVDLDADRFGEVTYSLQSVGSVITQQRLDIHQQQQQQQQHLLLLSGATPSFPAVRSALFDIDPKSGSIFTLESLDREQRSSYHLIVRASDGGLPPRTSQCTVIVYVADENDNDPLFEFPTASNSTVLLSNLAERRFIVARLRAKDADFSGNARVTYSLLRETSYFHLAKVPDVMEEEEEGEGGEEEGEEDGEKREGEADKESGARSASSSSSFSSSSEHVDPVSDEEGNVVDETSTKFFHVDPTLGLLYLLDDLEKEDGKSFVLWLRVGDEGIPERSSIARLVVVVNSSAPFPVPGPEDFFQESISGGYFSGTSGRGGSHHFWIVLLLAIISCVVVVILLVAIVVVCRQDDKRSSDSYNCRMESLKMIPPPGRPKNSNLLDAELSDRDENNKVTYNQRGKGSTASSCERVASKESEEKLFKSIEECHDVIKATGGGDNRAASRATKGQEEGSLNSSGECSNPDSGRGCSDEGIGAFPAAPRLPKNLNSSSGNQRVRHQPHDVQPNNPSASTFHQTTTILISPSLCDYDNYNIAARPRLVGGSHYPALKAVQAKMLNNDQSRSSNLNKPQQFQQPLAPAATLGRCSAKSQQESFRHEPGDDDNDDDVHQHTNLHSSTIQSRMGVKSSTPVYFYPYPAAADGIKRLSHPQHQSIPQSKNYILHWPDNAEYRAAVGLGNVPFDPFGNDAMVQNRQT